jgi:hypothetical protein
MKPTRNVPIDIVSHLIAMGVATAIILVANVAYQAMLKPPFVDVRVRSGNGLVKDARVILHDIQGIDKSIEITDASGEAKFEKLNADPPERKWEIFSGDHLIANGEIVLKTGREVHIVVNAVSDSLLFK